MQYESPITSGLKLFAKVKVFVHATDADGRAMALAPRSCVSWFAKKGTAFCYFRFVRFEFLKTYHLKTNVPTRSIFIYAL